MNSAILIAGVCLMVVYSLCIIRIGGRIWRFEFAQGEHRVYLYKAPDEPVPVERWLYRTALWSNRLMTSIVLILVAGLLLKFFQGAD